MPILNYKEFSPDINVDSFIAPDAWVTGNVCIEKDVTVLFGCSIRGDIEGIKICEGSNIQDLSVLHTSKGVQDCIVGPYTTVGHRVILHSCNIKGHSIIGMGSTILDKAVIGENCIIGANSLVTIGAKIPDGTLAFVNPAKVIRDLTKNELDQIKDNTFRYIITGREYRILLAPTMKSV